MRKLWLLALWFVFAANVALMQPQVFRTVHTGNRKCSRVKCDATGPPLQTSSTSIPQPPTNSRPCRASAMPTRKRSLPAGRIARSLIWCRRKLFLRRRTTRSKIKSSPNSRSPAPRLRPHQNNCGRFSAQNLSGISVQKLPFPLLRSPAAWRIIESRSGRLLESC